MKKENFIENILNSTNGITKISPSDTLLNKIYSKIEENKPINNSLKWFIAASIIVLISLNIGVLTYSNTKTNQQSELSPLMTTTNNQLY